MVLSFEYPFVNKVYLWHGIEVIAFGGANKTRLRRLRNWLKVWHALKQLRKEREIIGLLSFWFDECAFIGHYFAKMHALKHYSWILGQDAKAGNRYFKWVRPSPGSLIALSDFVARETTKNYGITPGHTITTGIDTRIFGHGKRRKDIDVVGVGSLIPLKQFELFVEAVRFLREFIPDIHTVICGDGPEKEELSAIIKWYRLENNITLAGELPHREVLACMQRSKILLHTSRYEGFGAVLLEALYSGAQVVSFVKPMDATTRHHYVVKDMTELCHKLLDLLQAKTLNHDPVMVYPIENSTSQMMELFDYKEAAIC